jgi:hypothetical protein
VGETSGFALNALDTTPVTATGVRRADEVCPAVDARRFLHAGPPIALADIVGPVRGAVLGALVFEGQADDVRDAERILARGQIELLPCHDAGGVGAMAGIVTPSMPAVVVGSGNGVTSFAPLNEGLGQALRFGSNDDAVLSRLVWMRDVVAPLLDAAIDDVGGLDVIGLQSEGLRRGDECHNRNVASTAAIIAMLAPSIARLARKPAEAAAVLRYMASNPHFFLSFSMAAAKVLADCAQSSADPGVVTAICANGRSLGIRVSGLGDRWFLDDAPIGNPKLFPGYTLEDVCPALGDSYITEVVGLGAFALVAAPALTVFTGGDPALSSGLVDELRTITRGSSSRFLVPSEGFRGTPLGIDVRLIEQTGVSPLVNNGLAHCRPGVGQVGAGLTRLRVSPFVAASRFLSEQEKASTTIASDDHDHGVRTGAR